MMINTAAVIGAVLTLSTVAGTVIVVEDRYAKQRDVETVASNTQQLFVDFRIEQTRNELNRLIRKAQAGKATVYDEQEIKHLERELDRLYEMKKGK